MRHLEGDYGRDGFVVARQLLGPTAVEAVRVHLASLVASRPSVNETNFLSGDVVADPRWLALVADARLLDFAERILGPDLALFSSNYVVKPPSVGKPVAWHQDGPRWPLDPVTAVSLGVAVDDADEGNGGLRVVPGSHASGFRGHIHDPAGLAGSVFPVATEISADEARCALQVDLRAGDVSAHHPALLHGSGPNLSERRRAALVVRYIPTSVRITVSPWPSRVVLRGGMAVLGSVGDGHAEMLGHADRRGQHRGCVE